MNSDDYEEKAIVEYDWGRRELRSLLIPSIRCNTSSVLIKDKLYIVGGRGVGQFNEVWAFSLSENVWELVTYQGDPPCSRDGHTVTKVGTHSILIFGGRGICRLPEGDRAERSMDNQKNKALTQRDVFNDMFLFDSDEKKWSQIVRKSRCPSGRRGHTAIFIPPEPVKPQGRHHKAKVTFPSDTDTNVKGLLVLFGGASIEAAWGVEQILNELWIYNFDQDNWTCQKAKGNIPPPMYEHSATLVQDQIIYIGGIVGPHRPYNPDPDDTFGDNKNNRTDINASPSDMIQPVYLNSDVVVLNTRTWTWSSLDILSPLYEKAALRIHGHTTVLDPLNDRQLIIFGGKETGDWKGVYDSKYTHQHDRKRTIKGTSLVLNLQDRVMSPWKLDGCPEGRYGHTCVAAAAIRSKVIENTDSRDKNAYFPKSSNISISDSTNADGDREPLDEDVLYIFGGCKALTGGFCAPDIHVLVRRTHWEDERARSRPTSPKSFTPATNDNSSASVSAALMMMLRPTTPTALGNETPKEKLMRQASFGRVDKSYDEIKRALLDSRSQRVHGVEIIQLPSLIGLESSQNRSRKQSDSRPSSSNKSRRYSTAANLRISGSFESNIVKTAAATTASSSVISSDFSREVSRSKIENLSRELPPVIKGLTITQAKMEYYRLHPVPTRKAVFGENSLSMYNNSMHSRSHASFGANNSSNFRPQTF
eukprot:gene6640-13450_t